ncbi:MAG: hypothetical protein QG639_838, partial [Patescibacteria group bacterium]|nr:hypothetical protein [Patescibacteria group bacterium]
MRISIGVVEVYTLLTNVGLLGYLRYIGTMRFFRGLVSVLILLLLPSSVHAEGTYSNINTASSSDGGYDAVSWSQGYPLTIDSYGKYIVPIQPDGNSYYNIAYSNDKGATWSEQNLPSDEEFSNRSSVAYEDRK